MTTAAVEELLTRLQAAPARAPRVLSDALHGDDAADLRKALSSDPRFAPLLLRICQDASAIDQVRWVVRFVGAQRYAPAVPTLLGLWAKRIVGLSDQAGRALLQIGDPASLRSMAAALSELPFGLLGTVALEAAAALGELYERAVAAADRDTAARNVLAYLQQHAEVLKADPRFIELATRAAATRSPEVAGAARELLARILSPEELAAALAARGGVTGPERPPAPSEAALVRARGHIGRIRDALAAEQWRAPRADQAARLDAIEAVVGPLPAMLRVLYETIDGLDVSGSRPRDRVVVFALDEAEAAVDRFVRDYSPATTPRDLVPVFEFPIAPDAYTLRGLSGGPPVAVALPTADDDPRLENLSRRPKLGSYLARARRFSQAVRGG